MVVSHLHILRDYLLASWLFMSEYFKIQNDVQLFFCRWILALMTFRLDIHHLKGIRQVVSGTNDKTKMFAAIRKTSVFPFEVVEILFWCPLFRGNALIWKKVQKNISFKLLAQKASPFRINNFSIFNIVSANWINEVNWKFLWISMRFWLDNVEFLN